jgi:hypothetical protein
VRPIGYISQPNQIGKLKGRVQIRGAQPYRRGNKPIQPGLYRVERIEKDFDRDVSIHITFRASEWIAKQTAVRMMVKQALEVFFAQILVAPA